MTTRLLGFLVNGFLWHYFQKLPVGKIETSALSRETKKS